MSSVSAPSIWLQLCLLLLGCDQFRPPVPVKPVEGPDPFGATVALDAIGSDRLCRTVCSVVIVDSVVRSSPTVRWFVPEQDRVAFVLKPLDLAMLRARGVPAVLGGTARQTHGDTARVTLSIVAYTFGNAQQVFGAATFTSGDFRVFDVGVIRRRQSWEAAWARMIFQP